MKHEVLTGDRTSEERKRIKKEQKRILCISVIAIVVCGLLLFAVIEAILGLNGTGDSSTATEKSQEANFVQYLSEEWPDYPYENYEKDSNTLTVRGTAKITLEQAQKYGAASYDQALLQTYVDTACAIEAGVKTDCGLKDVTVILRQYSSDGYEIFTASSNGTIKTCWDNNGK